jgi:hypothetical protein
MKKLRRLLLVMVLVLGTDLDGWAAGSASPEVPALQIPVRIVVLFSSGVGYFEHAGIITGNAATELRFKTSQINDILKSLVLEDRAGMVTAVVFPSQDPLSKTL